MRVLLVCVFAILSVVTTPGSSAVLDPESAGESPLLELDAALDAAGVDVAFNLNRRHIAGVTPRRPRIGALADLPPLVFPTTPELLAWEAAFAQGDIGLLAFLPSSANTLGFLDFYQQWLAAPAGQRHVLSYHRNDSAVPELLRGLLADGHATLQLSVANGDAESGGRLYATAGRRWAVDSVTARDTELEIPEFALLGEVLQRDSASAIDPDSRAQRRLASAEPAVFLKESLGDEFEASTIPEIIVPGGIAFGENAVFQSGSPALEFAENRLWLLHNGTRVPLPEDDVKTWKAAFDFAERSGRIDSDAIVDIDERGRVRLSSTLKDTDLGGAMVRIDLEPFNYVTRLDVLKSVIIDTSVRFDVVDELMQFATQYEVRFLQSDRLRIARTQVALVYRYESAGGTVSFEDAWGPEAFRLEGRTDYEGLGASTAAAGRYAAWIALFRSVHENAVDFSHGRYEFMKLDKAGRSTPTRM
jgi:hypothetical protein